MKNTKKLAEDCSENIAISLKNVTKDYGNGHGIFDFSFEVRRGEVLGLVGTNGSGKTTTIRQIMGFLKPDEGKISCLGKDSFKDAADFMKHVGYVPGQIDFPDVGSGRTFLKLQAELLGLKDLSYMNQLIDDFKLDIRTPLRRMSKGMKQKTALVAAMMAKPEILILDEPSTGLDPVMRDVLLDHINQAKEEGRTVFMSCHILEELDETADRVLFIHNGHIVDMFDRTTCSDGKLKQYKIGFEDDEEYRRFKTKHLPAISRYSDKNRHLTISCADENLNEMFAELSKLQIRYMNYRPFTLEWYYKEYVEEKEKKAC